MPLLREADTDFDGLDDLWEDLHFGDNSGTVEPSDLTPQDGTGDPDTDGANTQRTPAALVCRRFESGATSAWLKDPEPGD